MNERSLYVDGNDDLWVFFESQTAHVDGPFLFCFDSRTLAFKRHIRLFTAMGRQLIDGSPFFAAQDALGRFILAGAYGDLAKFDRSGQRLFHKAVQKHEVFTTRGKSFKRPYFVRELEKRREGGNDRGPKGSISHLLMLSMAVCPSRNLIFVGQGCRCCPNDIVVINDEGKLLYHFPFPVGPEALCARGGKLYLADYYHNFVHVTDYEGRWIQSFDVLGETNRWEKHYQLEGGSITPTWGEAAPESHNEKKEETRITAMCPVGESDLALAMTDGSILLLGANGELKRKTAPPGKGLYPCSMAADSTGELYIYYVEGEHSGNYLGIYRLSQDGRISGPFMPGELGIFESRESYLMERIASASADAYDYFDLADIQIRKEALSQETVDLLRKAISLKPDFWLATAYLGLTLQKMGDIAGGVVLMEEAFPKILCPVLAAEILIYHYRAGDKDKVMSYYRALEAIDEAVEMDWYSESVTTEEIKKFLELA